MFYGEVFKALNKARIKYVVVGGTAVVLHGYPRYTEDLDLIVLLEEKNLDKFFETLKAIGYLPRVPVTKEQFKSKEERAKWQKEKGMVVFSFHSRKPPFKTIDMFVSEPIRFELLHKERVRMRIQDLVIPVISIEHLKKLKKMAGRDVDLNDLAQLEAIERIQRKAQRK